MILTIVGIVLGVTLGVIGVGFYMLFCCFRRRKTHRILIENKNIINVNNMMENGKEMSTVKETPDKYFKNIYKNINITSSIKYDESIKKKSANILEITYPESFIPDLIVLNEKKCLMVEFDEGGDFHSKTNNINYVMKWIQYNRCLLNNEVLINDKTYEFSLIRITYPSNYNSNKLNPFKQIIDELIEDVNNSGKQHYCLVKIYKDKIVITRVNIPNLTETISPLEIFESENKR